MNCDIFELYNPNLYRKYKNILTLLLIFIFQPAKKNVKIKYKQSLNDRNDNDKMIIVILIFNIYCYNITVISVISKN